MKIFLKGLRWQRFLPLILIGVIMIIAYSLGLQKYFTAEMLKSHHQVLKMWVSSYPFLAPFLYILIYILVVVLSLPGGAVLSLVGGFLFPIPWSTLYVVIGASLGATVIFLAAKTAFSEILKKKIGGFLKKMEQGFQKNAWSYLLFLRFIPIFPFWLVNIAPAFFRVSLLTYFWTTIVGIIPGSYAYTQAGAGIGAILDSGQPFSIAAIFNIQMRIALVVLAVLALVPIIVKKYFIKKRD